MFVFYRESSTLWLVFFFQIRARIFSISFGIRLRRKRVGFDEKLFTHYRPLPEWSFRIDVASREFFKLSAFLHKRAGGKTNLFLYIISLTVRLPPPSGLIHSIVDTTEAQRKSSEFNVVRCRWRFSAHAIRATRENQTTTIDSVPMCIEKFDTQWYAVPLQLNNCSWCAFVFARDLWKKIQHYYGQIRFNCARRNSRSKHVKSRYGRFPNTHAHIMRACVRIIFTTLKHFSNSKFSKTAVERRYAIRFKRYIAGSSKIKTAVTRSKRYT